MEKYQYHIFSPYRVCPLGAHVDHQHGLVTGFAIDKGVDLWFIDKESRDRGFVIGGKERVMYQDMMKCCWPAYLTVMYDAEKVGRLQLRNFERE